MVAEDVAEPGAVEPRTSSLRSLLAGYDREVEASLREAIDATTGLERVRILHQTRRVVAVHDAVLRSALCPLLEDLPGGHEIAERLRHGCDERAKLLGRYEALTKNVAAPNVYPVSGEEIEEILEGLERSLREHVHDETTQVGDLLSRFTDSIDPDVVAVRMALEAERAPTRSHHATVRRPRSALLKRYYRMRDGWADWRDAHHGWLDPRTTKQSPQALEVATLKGTGAATPTVRDVLGGYDATVRGIIEEWRTAPDWAAKSDAVQRLSAAITVHDAVLGGVLCPLVDALPGGKEPAERLREGCRQRAELQRRIYQLGDRVTAGEGDDRLRTELEAIIDALVESFHAHEQEETKDVTELLERLPPEAYRTKSSLLADVMWPWHSEGPELLALRMALWAESSPSRAHPLLARHPTSRILRSAYRLSDHWSKFSARTPLQRWFAPKLPPAPFSSSKVHEGPRDGSAASGDNRL